MLNSIPYLFLRELKYRISIILITFTIIFISTEFFDFFLLEFILIKILYNYDMFFYKLKSLVMFDITVLKKQSKVKFYYPEIELVSNFKDMGITLDYYKSLIELLFISPFLIYHFFLLIKPGLYKYEIKFLLNIFYIFFCLSVIYLFIITGLLLPLLSDYQLQIQNNVSIPIFFSYNLIELMDIQLNIVSAIIGGFILNIFIYLILSIYSVTNILNNMWNFRLAIFLINFLLLYYFPLHIFILFSICMLIEYEVLLLIITLHIL